MADRDGNRRTNDPATLKIYGSVADKLELTIAERCAVLGLDRLTYDHWLANPTLIDLSEDHIERSSELLAVYDGLLKMFADRKVATLWLRLDNPDFGDRPPLEAMLSADTSRFRSVFDYIEGILIMCTWPEPCEN